MTASVYKKIENIFILSGFLLAGIFTGAFIYSAQKLPGMYHRLLEYLDELKQHRISGEIMILDPKTWQTPTRGLRSKGWKIRISFEDRTTDGEDLRVFMDYMMHLHLKQGKNSYRYFNMADLTVMTE